MTFADLWSRTEAETNAGLKVVPVFARKQMLEALRIQMVKTWNAALDAAGEELEGIEGMKPGTIEFRKLDAKIVRTLKVPTDPTPLSPQAGAQA